MFQRVFKFRCTKCEHDFDRSGIRPSDREVLRAESCINCHESGCVIDRPIEEDDSKGFPMIGGFNSFGGKKINSDMKNKLERMRKAYPGSTINDSGL